MHVIIMTLEKDIKKAVETKKILICAQSTLKALKRGELAAAVIASNCPEATKADLEHNAKVGGIALKQLEGTSADLGALCAKPFKIAVVGLLK